MKLGVASALLSLAFVSAFAFAGCDPKPIPQTVYIVCASDGGASEDDDDAGALGAADDCSLACRNLRVLGCPEGKTPEGGKGCTQICRDMLPISSRDPVCEKKAKTAAAVRACPRIKC